MNRLLLVTSILPMAALAQITPAQTEFFESRIRPVLAQQCFVCHTNSKMAGLRLDSREEILKGGKSGPALIPGDPDKSLLITAIKHVNSGLQMPKSAAKLTQPQIDDMTSWVKDGAYWPSETKSSANAKGFVITSANRKFWSIQPLAAASPPKVKDAVWPANDIDRFILARLEKDNLKPAAVAGKRTLLRRLSYDLTGLPPTFEEVKAFEADKTPAAYEKAVDRLLSSPRYGERWARHWLDVVRYAEDDYNVGKRPDRAEKYPFNYLYRDWVIKAINEDMPYDLFVKAQIAGDLMDEKIRHKTLAGVGMNGGGVWSFQDNPAPIERADEWNDKVDVTTKAFLGLTVGCARCHDHKYDPISTKDYYRIAGVFASSRFHAYPMMPKSVVDRYEAQKKVLEEKEAKLKKFLDQAAELYLQTLLSQTEEYMIAAYKLGSQKNSTVSALAEEQKLDAEMLDRWVRFLKKKPDNYSYLRPWQAMVDSKGKIEDAKKLSSEFYKKVLEIAKLRDKVKEENELALAKIKDPDEEKNEQFDPLPNGKKRRLNKHQIALKGLDREQSYLYRDMFEVDLSEYPGNPNAEEERKPGLLKLTGFGLEKRLTTDLAAHVTRLKADIEAFKKTMPSEIPSVYGLEDSKEATDLKIFVRGNPYTFGEDAPRAFLSLLSEGEPAPFTKGSGRLELAETIVKQPLAARVIVNRIWRWHMGSGIVDTPSNFGMVGERPTNPELLDYLAAKFTAEGMSWKKLHKEIVMSKTYQLDSVTVEANLAKDADNRLYWRGNRKRLEAEGVWDSLLAASGKLDLSKTGGPSKDLGDEEMFRRGVYGKVSRMYPNEFQTTFDFPTSTISSERRYTTNVAQQRLFFLNSPFVHKQAEAMAARVKLAGDEEAQVAKAYEIAYQRDPSAAEMKAAMELLTTAPAPAEAVSEGAWVPSSTSGTLASKPAPGEMPAVKDEPKAEKKRKDSPLKSLCWALLSSNEFLFLN